MIKKLFGCFSKKPKPSTYEILKRYPAMGPVGSFVNVIKCRVCGSISYSQEDVRQKYCAKCKMFHAN